ncbi:hypothetical protein FEK33_11470 [Nocardia asteroides NBRC 15531]|uniref:DUF5709 domain-containing protein n=1 Tax=Nocardia asteroides NBRC 15531 TaxID=1110697 RepID=U5E7C6_NOCAS|nr:hypothetical protein [Nocardia asteroides]TLF66661.1 hypothetical protein FEK33_11470 [Nocardia asteroides NBRC 15531]UGT46235.1 hypothetical protein LT345_16760 [Nocardia asteroides]SFM97698.1 hypothetical protein SAMN05444423_105193 [Nocardia asteroides]VEG34967.1 Uncharacterised protein [Nocardia asteroides]GAD82308.1 hypothetical protein NCAST_08_01800 [Nocardia asteroides NBRC 15531]
MTEPDQTYDPPQDTGAPDAVETDPAALNSSEDIDEDRLRQDPLEEGMDPPEHWTGVTKYGMTPAEEARPRGLGERLAEEEPDVVPGSAPQAAGEAPTDLDDEGNEVAPGPAYEEELGISADVAGGSVPREIRQPPPAD